jgi:hypothetical protein
MDLRNHRGEDGHDITAPIDNRDGKQTFRKNRSWLVQIVMALLISLGLWRATTHGASTGVGSAKRAEPLRSCQ